jgi:hypothetical protein
MATTNPVTEPRLTQHPISAVYPAMTDAEFTALVDHIKVKGQQLAITVYDGQVLDGWHRYRACQQLGIIPTTTEFTGTVAEAVDHVVGLNECRRHLTPSQRAMVAAKLAAYGPGRPSTKTPQKCGVSTKQAAAALKVGPRTVECAKTVLKHGSPEIIRAVETGKLRVVPAATRITAANAPPEDTTVEGPKVDETKKLPAYVQRLQFLHTLQAELFAALERIRCQVRWSDRKKFLDTLTYYQTALEPRAWSTKATWERPLDDAT